MVGPKLYKYRSFVVYVSLIYCEELVGSKLALIWHSARARLSGILETIYVKLAVDQTAESLREILASTCALHGYQYVGCNGAAVVPVYSLQSYST